jgi:hypothetical protein
MMMMDGKRRIENSKRACRASFRQWLDTMFGLNGPLWLKHGQAEADFDIISGSTMALFGE